MASPADTQAPRPPVLCVLGPTAAGKTDLAIALAQRFSCDLISVDSAMVYRGMDIGTAKPDAATLARAPHRLIDIRDPAEPYSAADFCADARREIDAIHAAGRVPLLVGGTMLYFKALLEGLAQMPAADPAVRAAIEREAAEQGWPALHRQLAAVDPDSAARLHPNHSRRIARALEVYRVSGLTMTELHRRQQATAAPYRAVQLAIAPAERAVLHRRIEQRLQAMFAAGFVEEVRALHQRGDLSPELPALCAVGYRQVWEYLDGASDYTTMHARALAATRQLAKRQLTWLRGWAGLHWIYTDASGTLAAPAAENPPPEMAPVELAINYLASVGIFH